MKRGDLVTIVTSGDYGKPRPALIVQSDAYADHPSLTLLPLTSELRDTPKVRITLEANTHTGLQRRSQVMVDKAVTISRLKVGTVIGEVDASTMAIVGRALGVFLETA